LRVRAPELPEERQQEIGARVREGIEGSGGSWGPDDVWGRRRLAYEIDHKAEGVYHLLTFEAEPEALEEVSRVLKITDGVMRHLAVKRTAATGPTRPLESTPEHRQDSEEQGTTVGGGGFHGRQHQQSRPRGQSDQGSRAPAHAERDPGLQPSARRQHTPQGWCDRRMDREAELFRHHRLGQPGRELRAVPLEGPP